MFDSRIRPLINPPLNAMGKALAGMGVTANATTLAGLAIGLIAALLIALGNPMLALIPLLLSRIADGLDGAVARATQKTDFGGYLDIAADFLFYGLIPLAFVAMNPDANGLAGAFLLTSFYFNGTSFLGFAILAEKHDMATNVQGEKSLYYSNGILEGAETIAFFALLCLLPSWFVPLAYVFGVACFVTGFLRIYGAHRTFTNKTTHLGT